MKLGLSLHLFSEGRRRQACLFLEQARKIGLIFNTDGCGNVDDGLMSLCKQAFGPLDTHDVNPSSDTPPCRLFDQAAEIVLADAALCGVGGNAPRPFIGLEDGLQKTAYDRRNGRSMFGLDAGQKKVQAFLYKDAVSFFKGNGQHIEEHPHECSFVKPEALVKRGRQITERLGVGQEGRCKTSRVADGVPVVADGKRTVLRNQQNLPRLTEKRGIICFQQDLAGNDIHKADEWKPCLRRVRRLKETCGVHSPDEERCAREIGFRVPWGQRVHL